MSDSMVEQPLETVAEVAIPEGDEQGPKRVKLTAPLRHPNYLKLWIAQTISVLGDKLDQIALAILVFERTGSMLQMGVMLGISTLPAALFSVPAGVFVDRWDRRMTMIWADVIRAGIVAAVPFVAAYSIAAVYALAFVAATVALFFQPARLALVPELVDEEELMAANSLDEGTIAASELLGLALGGGLVAIVGWQLAFYADAFTFIVSAVVLLTIRHRSVVERVGSAGTGIRELASETATGLRYLWDTRVLRDLTGVYAVTALAGSAMITLAHLLALWTFDGGATGLAWLDGAITVGLIVGSVLVGRSGNAQAGLKFLGGILAFGVLMLALAFVPQFVPALAILALAGVANIWFSVPAVVILQERTADELRGRVFGARTAVARITGSVGLIAGGALAQQFGVETVVGAMGVLLLLTALVGFSLPSLRTA